MRLTARSPRQLVRCRRHCDTHKSQQKYFPQHVLARRSLQRVSLLSYWYRARLQIPTSPLHVPFFTSTQLASSQTETTPPHSSHCGTEGTAGSSSPVTVSAPPLLPPASPTPRYVEFPPARFRKERRQESLAINSLRERPHRGL